MFARVQELTHPKSEHTAESNEDAIAYDAAAGLFAIADGVGSTSFSGEWARILVQHFVAEPLLSDDPFEVEWWLRRAQRLYDEHTPRPESLPPFAQEKARQGGAATLATLRLTAVEDHAVVAEVLACGDSCAILRRAGCATLESFPLRSAEEFNSVTLALPARTRYFDRRRQRCQRWTLSLAPGDSLILATDAVAKAILAGGVSAFRAVAAARPEAAPCQGVCAAARGESPDDWRGAVLPEGHMAPESGPTRRGAEWSAIVSRWRRRGILADDDATALVICIGEGEAALGCRPAPAAALVAARQAELAAALGQERLESVAVAYGDGSYFAEAQLAPVHAEQARLVAGALLELRMAMMGHLAARQQDATPLAAVWERWAPLLAGEPSAAALRQSLVQLGVPLAEPVWPHVAAFRTAIDRADVSAVAMLAPPEALSYLLTDSEWTLVHRARRQVRRGRRARGTAAAPGARGR